MRPLFENIPAALRDRRQFVVWLYEERDAKPTKVLYCPRNGRRARTQDTPGKEYRNRPEDTWRTFQEAVRAYERGHTWDGRRYDGIGFVFTAGDELAGLDLDDCIDDGGNLVPWVQEFVTLLDSYTEISPSGRGLKIVVKAEKPGSRCRTGNFEFYQEARFFTLTGRRLPGTPTDVQERQAEYAAAYRKVFPPDEKPVAASGPVIGPRSAPPLDDIDLLSKALSSANGPKFAALYGGDWQAYYGSHSEADASLYAVLYWWTNCDEARADDLFRQSALYREKWDRHDYWERTRRWAHQHIVEGYDPAEALSWRRTFLRSLRDRVKSDLDSKQTIHAGVVGSVPDAVHSDIACRAIEEATDV